MSTVTAVVETTLGRVQGREREGVHSFLGIPYAAPPFGARRLRPPEPHERWDGVRDATDYGATVPKSQYPPPYDALLRDPEIAGDDCLNLNVWTPDPNATGLPVFFWIHGGGFTNGSGAVLSYAGDAFARSGVVAATINYRLGVDGFLYTGDDVANTGLLDQMAALEWVRDNIAAFGGDPDEITIAGESAGAASVYALLASPRADGLFKRAIAQSGGGVAHPAETGRRVAEWLASYLEIEPTRAAFAEVPFERLIEAQAALSIEVRLGRSDPARWGELGPPTLAFAPTVDGDVLPQLPADRIAAGASRDVTLLAGSNTDEDMLFIGPTGFVHAIDETALAAAAARFGLDGAAVDVYRAARPNASPGELLAAIGTDARFRVPAIRIAESRAAAPAKTFLYEFAWRSPALDGSLGACHALEIPFVFDTLDAYGFGGLAGDDPPRQLAQAMHSAWVAFVTSGDPGWPAYEPGRRQTMRFDVESELAGDVRAAEREVWSR